jgi:hypothetical protein
VDLNLYHSVPDGLTQRARYFVALHGVRVDVLDVDEHRAQWLKLGIPAAEIDRAKAFQQRWGGIVLPPAPDYSGGPRFFYVDTPEGSSAEGWWFEAGLQRSAIPYSFMIGPTGEFGIHAKRWVPLHATIEGWVESLALADHAARWAKQITKLTGDAVNDLELDEFEPVTEVRGLADTWWRGVDSLVAIYSGESMLLSGGQEPRPTARIYSGLDRRDFDHP